MNLSYIIHGSNLNLTAILCAVQRLPGDKKRQLLDLINIDSEEELEELVRWHTELGRASGFRQASGANASLSSADDMRQYPEYRFHEALLLYVPLILFVTGTVGNSLSFIVLTRRRMRQVSTYVYLAVLSVADTLVLVVGLLLLWVGQVTGRDVRSLSQWSCRLITVLGYTVSDYSVWLIIAVTVERYIAVCHPLRAAFMCNHRTAIRVVLAIFVLVLGVNINFLWMTEVQLYPRTGSAGNPPQQPHCTAAAGLEFVVNQVWPWVDAIIYSFLPFAIILFLNTLIIRRVVRARQDRRRDLSIGCGGYHRSSIQSRRVLASSTLRTHRQPSATETNVVLSLMLLTISFAFLVTTLPMNVTVIATDFWNVYAVSDLQLRARVQLARTITELLMYVNHSMNFFLYCATGQKFRQELCALVCRRKSKMRQYGTRTVSFNLVSRQSSIRQSSA